MPRAFRVTFQNHSNMQKAVRCLKRAAFFVDRRDAQYAPAECALDFGLAQSGNVLLSQVFPHALDPPPAAHMGEPNQVQCRTLVGIIRKTKLSGYIKRKDPPSRAGLSFHGIRQRPTLPGRLQPSTIGAERLNFCVRYGNRWIPFAIVTGNRIGFLRTLKTAHPDCLHLV